jgi:hypothetical protein
VSITNGFQWRRDVPPEWQADLDQLAPGDRVSRLVIHWNAGFEYEPVQRWCIWEVLPTQAVTTMLTEEEAADAHHSLLRGLWNDLQGPDPRTTGKMVKGRWRSKSLVSRMQWDIHREVGGLPLLAWVIEGSRGGHSWQCGPFEQGFLLALGIAPDIVQELSQAWPNPGSLPYAEYDRRVFNALAERDALRTWRQSLAWDGRSRRSTAGLILDSEALHRKTGMMERTMRWLEGQISDAVSDIPRTLLPQWSDFQQVDQAADEAAAHAHVVEE